MSLHAKNQFLFDSITQLGFANYVLGMSQYQKKADSPIRYIGADIKK
jgi:hypothetical protein